MKGRRVNPTISLLWSAFISVILVSGSIWCNQLMMETRNAAAEDAVDSTTSALAELIARIAENPLCQVMGMIALIVAVYTAIQAAAAPRDLVDVTCGDVDSPSSRRGVLRILSGRPDRGIDSLLAAPRAGTSAAEHRFEQMDYTRAAVSQPVRFAIWLLPLLGFLGTVYGISVAIDALKPIIDEGTSAVQDAMGGVIAGLRTAFDTTLFGIVLAVLVGLLHLPLTFRLMRVQNAMLGAASVGSETDNDAALNKGSDLAAT